MIRVVLVVLALGAVTAGIYLGLRLLFRMGFPSPDADPVEGEKVSPSTPWLEGRMAKVLLGAVLVLFLLMVVERILDTRQDKPVGLERPTMEDARP